MFLQMERAREEREKGIPGEEKEKREFTQEQAEKAVTDCRVFPAREQSVL